MARCYITGVEISLDDAFVLDLTVAHRTMRELREKVATLERLIAQLGQTDLVPIPNRGASGTFLRKDRRIVSEPMARVLSAVAPERELFLRWIEWRARGRSLPLTALREHPEYGERLRALSSAELGAVAMLARQVLDRLLTRAQYLAYDIRIALMAGVCASLRDRSAEEVVAILQHRIDSDLSLMDLGVPARIEGSLKDALKRRPADDWGTPGAEPHHEASVIAGPAADPEVP